MKFRYQGFMGSVTNGQGSGGGGISEYRMTTIIKLLLPSDKGK